MKPFAIAATVLAIISGLILQGTFGHTLIVIFAGILFGAPLVLILVIWFIIGMKRAAEIPNRLRRTFLASVIVCGSMVVSLGTGKAIHHWEITEARNYVANMVPILDQYRNDFGKYPQNLSIIGAPTPPKFLRQVHSYTATNNSFSFEYWDAAGMLAGYYFDSFSRTWKYFD